MSCVLISFMFVRAISLCATSADPLLFTHCSQSRLCASSSRACRVQGHAGTLWSDAMRIIASNHIALSETVTLFSHQYRESCSESRKSDTFCLFARKLSMLCLKASLFLFPLYILSRLSHCPRSAGWSPNTRPPRPSCRA